MKPIFNPEELTLMTEPEKRFFDEYVKQCTGFLNKNEKDGRMKQATAQAASIAKIVQSRVQVAALKLASLGHEDKGIHNRMVGSSGIVQNNSGLLPSKKVTVKEEKSLYSVPETKNKKLFIKFSDKEGFLSSDFSKELINEAKIVFKKIVGEHTFIITTLGANDGIIDVRNYFVFELAKLPNFGQGMSFKAEEFIKTRGFSGTVLDVVITRSPLTYKAEYTPSI